MKRGRSGLTLSEVLTASALMLMVTMFVMLAFRSMFARQRVGEEKSDAYRAVLVASGQLRQELRGVRVEQPSAGETSSRLLYRKPRLLDGFLELDFMGEMLFDGVTELRCQDGALMARVGAGTPQLLTRLGEPTSQFSVERQDDHLMVVTLTCVEGAVTRKVPLTFFLGNQP